MVRVCVCVCVCVSMYGQATESRWIFIYTVEDLNAKNNINIYRIFSIEVIYWMSN